MKVIGFANQFYTLWEVNTTTIDYGHGHKAEVTRSEYIKNISLDEETAKEKYPDARIDMSLKGKTRSFTYEKEYWDNVDTFRFGYNKYTKIDNAIDKDILWYYDFCCDEQKEYIEKLMTSRGYEVRKSYNSNILISPEMLNNERIQKEKFNTLVNEIKSNKELTFFCEYNPDSEGEYWTEDNNIHYHFQEVKENYYNGFNYYLPLLNGKAKRVKNKNIKVTDFTYEVKDNFIQVEILKFEIVK